MNESSGPDQNPNVNPDHPSPSPSPKWDSRRQSFISPTKLQEIRASTPRHNFTSSNGEEMPIAPSNSEQVVHARPGTGTGGAGHSRASSFFSFRGKDKSQGQQSQPQAGDLPMQRAPSMDQPRPQPQSAPAPAPPPTAPLAPAPTAPAPLHPEIRSIVSLTVSHAHKIYFSGPLIRRIERDPSGHKPTKDEGWVSIWAQLGGTTLSTWDMDAIREAEKKGTEVPPSYINMTDAFVQVLGSVTIPGDPGKGVEEKKYTNVLTLNTAGCNLLLFACPDTKSLISWASALRLSAWEKSRLEEIYTAHLIRITLSARDIPTTLIRNRLEGWVRIRIASQTEWKLVWMVVKGATGTGAGTDELGRVQSNTPSLSKDPAQKKKRISSFFGAGNGHGQPSSIVEPPSGPMVSFYTSPPQGLYPSSGAPTASSKLRLNRKNASNTNPLLTLPIISQVFAVYPERPELISRSTLFKIEGCFGDEEGAGSMRRREGWVLVMPQVEQGGATSQSQASAPNSTGGAGLSPAAEMLKWIIALHDAFNLYGRPQAWTWDPRDPQGLMFAYPVGPHKDLLFLDRELAETLDPRDDRTSSVRSALIGILGERMRLGGPNPAPNSMPTLPAGPGSNAGGPRSPTVGAGGGDIAPASRIPSGPQFQLPPLSFDSNRDEEDRDRDREDMGREMDRERALLTPITERSSVYTMQTTVTNFTGGGTLSGVGGVSVSPVPEEREMQNGSVSPKVPEKDRVSLSGSLRRRGDLSAGGGGKSSFDSGTGFSFANAVNTALPPSRSGTVDSFSTNFNTSTNTPPTRSSTMSASTPTSSTTRSPPPPGSPSMSSVLTSPYEQGQQQTPPQGFAQLQGQGQASTQFRDRDRASVQSFADKASVLTSPYSPAGSVDGHGQPGYGGASSPSWSQLGLGLGSSFGVGDGTGSGSSRRIPTTIRELDGDGDSDGDLDEASRQGQEKGQGGEDDEEDDDDESPDLRNRYQDVTSRGPSIPTPTPEVNPLQAATWANVNAKASPQGSPILQTASPISASGSPIIATVPRGLGALGRKPSGARAPQRHVMPMGATRDSSSANNNFSSSALASVTAQQPQQQQPATYNSQQQTQPQPQSQQSSRLSLYNPVEEKAEEEEEESEQAENGRPQQQQRQFSNYTSSSNYSTTSTSTSPPTTTPTTPAANTTPATTTKNAAMSNTHTHDDLNAGDDSDVLAVLSYLDVNDDGKEEPTSGSRSVQPLNLRSNATNIVQPGPGLGLGDQTETETELDPYAAHTSTTNAGSGVGAPTSTPPYKSSFAPSKHAAERKAKAQAQQAAQAAAASRPGARAAVGSSPVSVGRGSDASPGAKTKTRKMRAVPNPNSNAWGESSDEEDEEEDEEEEEEEDEGDVDSDAEPRGPAASSSGDSGGGMGGGQQQSHLRPPRTLPQIPGRMAEDDYPMPMSQRPTPEQFSQGARSTYFDDQPQAQPQHHLRTGGTPGGGTTGPRQSMWSQVLDPNHTPGAIPPTPNPNDPFVQLEPSQMTKAFTPQGLLSAGLADRSDRSAKRQEALARESGASLINVPNKPPPPQTGLLGAITAHERERKREGGMGAALTERERERRVAEERQRRWDEQQRAQMEGMQQGGNPMSMYGGFPGMNPMMMNPMMMGMNPMMTGMGMGMNPMMTGMGGMNPMMPNMTGGGAGYPGMMPNMTGSQMQMQGGYNPVAAQFAQQAAQQAYQQAMMAFSVSGSQVGGEGGGGGGSPGGVGAPGAGSMNPMMTGGAGGGYDPRMSMMSMGGGMGMNPMMGMGGMGMNPMMSGMGMGMPPQSQSPQSQFDPRFSPNNGTPSPMNLNPNDTGSGSMSGLGLGAGLLPGSRGSSSPVRKGSPLARPGNLGNLNDAGAAGAGVGGAGSSSRPATPAA